MPDNKTPNDDGQKPKKARSKVKKIKADGPENLLSMTQKIAEMMFAAALGVPKQTERSKAKTRPAKLNPDYDDHGLTNDLLEKSKVPRLHVSSMEDLAARTCGEPNCVCCNKDVPTVFQVPCHPTSGVRLMYVRGSGDVYVGCPVCGKISFSIGVALI